MAATPFTDPRQFLEDFEAFSVPDFSPTGLSKNRQKSNATVQLPGANDSIEDQGAQTARPPTQIQRPEVPGNVTIKVEADPTLKDNDADPALQQLLALQAKTLDPKYQYLMGRMNVDRQKELNEQTQRLSLDKQRQMDRRLIEQENIRAWRDTYKAQVYANAQLALGTASAIASAMRPNTEYMGQLTNAMKAAQEAGLRGN